MKHTQLLIILGVVILAHLLFILAIKPARRKTPHHPAPTETRVENSGEANPEARPSEQPGTASQQGTQQAAAQSGTGNAPEPAGNVFAIRPFAPGYFKTETKQIPQHIASLVGNCRGGIAVNLSTRTIVWSKNPDTPLPIASITKMMTVLLTIEKMRLSKGAITLETPIRVTANAARIGARQAWIDPRETFTLDEMLKATMIHSANDCAYLLAEFTSGSEPAFVSLMNERAQQLGCRSFTFINSHGLPDNGREDMASPRELAYLADVLLDIPEITKWSHLRQGTLRENDEAYVKRNKGPFMLSSSNSLLGKCEGVNGMKTGYTKKAGFSIVATCERNGVRTVVVTLGCDTKKNRDNLTAALINWLYQ